MSGLKEQLLEVIEEIGSRWTQDEKDLARLIADDYASLTVRKIKGEDVDAELAHAKAQAMAIGAAAAVSAANAFWERATAILGGLLTQLQP